MFRNKPAVFLLAGELHLLVTILKMLLVTRATCSQTALKGDGRLEILYTKVRQLNIPCGSLPGQLIL